MVTVSRDQMRSLRSVLLNVQEADTFLWLQVPQSESRAESVGADMNPAVADALEQVVVTKCIGQWPVGGHGTAWRG